MAKRTEVLVARFYKQIAYVTLLTALLWTLFAIYGALKTEYPTDVKAEILESLNPSIDTKIIEALKTRTNTQVLIESYSPTSEAQDQDASSGL